MGLYHILETVKSIFSHQSSFAQDLLPSERKLLAQISRLNAQDQDITNELYQRFRQYEMDWLERHYDFNTIRGVNSIPVSPHLPGAPSALGSTKGHTGEVYYYLRRKAYNHEDTGNIELALACMRKSVSLAKCRSYFSVDDLLPLVKMLARAGYIEDAYTELRSIEQLFSSSLDCNSKIESEIRRGQERRDFQWIQENFPDKCPKSVSSFRRMKTQNTKNYQAIKALAAAQGREI